MAEQRASQTLKDALTCDAVVAYFDPELKTEIEVDTSLVGLAGILTQEGRVIAYGSRSLTDVETRYSQTEREALAVVLACEHFDLYVRGKQFTIYTDHKPLVYIWKKPKPPLRIERWSTPSAVLLQDSGKDNTADYMSRYQVATTQAPPRTQQMAEENVNLIASEAVPKAMILGEVKRATLKDKTLQVVAEFIRTDHRQEAEKMYDLDTTAIRSFVKVKDELTVSDDNSLILRGTRIVLPRSLQQRALDIAYEGHLCMSKTKALIRTKVWFPCIDKCIDKLVREVMVCPAKPQHR